MPLGSMPIIVGMYDLLTEERLPVDGSLDGVVPLTEIIIEESSVRTNKT